jgi:cytochrome c oxidase subunit 2
MSLWDFPLLPETASTHARRVDLLFWTWTGLTGVVALAIALVILTFLLRYRRASASDRTPPRLPTHAMEWTWILVPFAIFMGMFGWAAWLYYEAFNPPPDAHTVYVVGKQWMWKVQHPEGPREIDELHVPVGRPVRLVLTSQDAIHDFAVPAFRLKQDVLPGRYTEAWFQATQVGRFRLFCSEYCGTSHARMTGWVVVQAPADHAAWLARAGAAGDMAAQGARLFRQHGCTGCHGPASVVHAPPLEGIYGRRQPLAGGGFATADDAYLRDSILLPGRQVVAGYEPLMPSYQGQLGEDEILALVAYLKSTRSTP